MSLLLDGELSELERRMLEAHLVLCHECSSYSEKLTTFTEQLRSAPLLPLRRSVVVRAPRRVSRYFAQSGVAAVLGLVALGLTSQFVGSQPKSDVEQPFIVTDYAPQAELEHEQALFDSLTIRRTASSSNVVL